MLTSRFLQSMDNGIRALLLLRDHVHQYRATVFPRMVRIGHNVRDSDAATGIYR